MPLEPHKVAQAHEGHEATRPKIRPWIRVLKAKSLPSLGSHPFVSTLLDLIIKHQLKQVSQDCLVLLIFLVIRMRQFSLEFFIAIKLVKQ